MSEVKTVNEKETAYQPAFDINRLTIAYLLEAMDQRGVESIPVAQSRELGVLSEALEGIREAIAQSPANRLIKDI